MEASGVLRRMLGMPKAEIEAFLGQSTLAEIDAIAEAPSADALHEILNARADRLAASPTTSHQPPATTPADG